MSRAGAAMAGQHHYCTITCLSFFLFAAAAVFAAARDLDGANPFPAPAGRQQGPYYYGYGAGGGIPGFLPRGFFGGPGNGGFYGGPAGNGIPAAGAGGWGAGGYGGPGGGGYAHGGVEVPTVVCQEKGPCYGKKVTCPTKCFWSYSRAGNGYGAGGGGGSCTVDCKYKCIASC